MRGDNLFDEGDDIRGYVRFDWDGTLHVYEGEPEQFESSIELKRKTARALALALLQYAEKGKR